MYEKKLLVGTFNRGKQIEFQRLFEETPFVVVGPREFNIKECVEETGSSFRENAQLKAAFYGRLAGCLTLADDSGLEVDALAGAPGVHSARYGGEGLDAAGRVELLLNSMEAVPAEQRMARFRCVLALYCHPNENEFTLTEGSVEGLITRKPMGAGGFGYDPIFWVPSEAATIAMLEPARKNSISHRGKAARLMRKALLQISERRIE